jgi:hypothetical protein
MMGSWRLSFHIDEGAYELERGHVAGGGTEVGDAGVQGPPYSKNPLFILVSRFSWSI